MVFGALKDVERNTESFAGFVNSVEEVEEDLFER